MRYQAYGIWELTVPPRLTVGWLLRLVGGRLAAALPNLRPAGIRSIPYPDGRVPQRSTCGRNWTGVAIPTANANSQHPIITVGYRHHLVGRTTRGSGILPGIFGYSQSPNAVCRLLHAPSLGDNRWGIFPTLNLRNQKYAEDLRRRNALT